jgi:hypothetical protein
MSSRFVGGDMKPSRVWVCAFLLASPFAYVSADNPALSFDGVNDFARMLNTAVNIPVGNAAYTEELWVNVQGWPDYGGGYEGFLLSRGAEGVQMGCHIVLLNHHIGLTHWGSDRDTGIALEADRWYHVATTYDGTTEKLYVDGQLRWQAPLSGLNVQPTVITFGRHNNYSNYFFQGLMDEVRIWNYVRTNKQIAANAKRLIDPASPGLVAYWRMDELNGQYLIDSSSSANFAVLGATMAPATDDPTRTAFGAVIYPPCVKDLVADINFDCAVDSADLLLLAEKWLSACDPAVLCGDADIDRSGRVDLMDMATLAAEWLR